MSDNGVCYECHNDVHALNFKHQSDFQPLEVVYSGKEAQLPSD